VKQEELAMYLAKNKEEVLFALGAKKRKVAPKKKPAAKVVDVSDSKEDAA
jgi:dsDNA-binding SOS-regulon protein